jgi:integrase
MEDVHANSAEKPARRPPWNKGKIVGAKPPLRPSHVWSIRTKLQIEGRKRDLALFNLAIDSKLRGCDLVAVRVDDVAPSGYAMDRATIRQKKTGRPVRFELTDQARMTIDEYLKLTGSVSVRWSPRRCTRSDHAAVCAARAGVGGQHRVRHALAAPHEGGADLSADGEPQSVQLLLGHSKIESTVRYLGIEVDDAIEIAEKIDI